MVGVTLAQMEAFYWTARLGSVRAAAERLNLTQPSLSLRLRSFAEALDTRPFRKVGRRLALTAEGTRLLGEVEQILRLARALGAPRGSAKPKLIRLGVTDIFALTSLAELLTRCSAGDQAIDFEITVAFSSLLSEMLEAGKLDVGILTNPRLGRGFILHKLAAVPIAWMAPPRLGLGARPLTPADIASLPVFTNPAPSHLSETIRAWFASAGIVPHRLHTCNTLPVLAHLAAVLGGATVLPLALLGCEHWGEELVALDVTPPLAPHLLYAVIRREAADPATDAVVASAHALVRATPGYL
ncbi:MAG: LysR family transcriptional regulator [Elioraea sp.]|nr:LysR family transcriptional regulator [Elioraea sp.]